MLKIQNQAHFDKVQAHANAIGLADNLQKNLERLLAIANNMGGVCHLGFDFAPYSFSFAGVRGETTVINGGLIFHGAHDIGGDGSDPTLSVSLSPTTGWQIHS